VNDRDPSGLAAGPARPPKSVCANSHDKGTCETAVKREESCGRLGCKDASEAHKALPEAIGVGLFVSTGGLGDLAEGFGAVVDSATASDRAASALKFLSDSCNTTCRGLAGYAGVASVSALAKGYAQHEEDVSTNPNQKYAWGFAVKFLSVADPFSGGVGAGG
jgi:hypothetical protein